MLSKLVIDPKIDNRAVDGLLGVNNSLAYKVHEIEKHFHNQEKWCGVAAIADAELHVADPRAITVTMTNVPAPGAAGLADIATLAGSTPACTISVPS